MSNAKHQIYQKFNYYDILYPRDDTKSFDKSR